MVKQYHRWWAKIMSQIRCNVVCEGQTEVDFVKQILAPYFILLENRIELVPLKIPTSNRYKGGALTYDRVERFIINQLKKDKNAFLTTMFDYYALDNRFKENIPNNSDIYLYITAIQDNFDKHINNERFFFHIQPHEFESLLFSDVTKIIQADLEWEKQSEDKKQKALKELQNIINDYDENPELINNSKETSPSHRLQKILGTPKYNKAFHGNEIAKKIGLKNICDKCHYFDSWCQKIRNLKNSYC